MALKAMKSSLKPENGLQMDCRSDVQEILNEGSHDVKQALRTVVELRGKSREEVVARFPDFTWTDVNHEMARLTAQPKAEYAFRLGETHMQVLGMSLEFKAELGL
jgi:hypothetical protein